MVLSEEAQNQHQDKQASFFPNFELIANRAHAPFEADG
jgi:hypothetical protein